MTELIYVKPTGSVPVRDPADPQRAHLPPEGKGVMKTTYWLRRLADKDVAKTTKEAVAEGKAKREAAEKAAAAKKAAAEAAAAEAAAETTAEPAAKSGKEK